jgi:hypothetical protein
LPPRGRHPGKPSYKKAGNRASRKKLEKVRRLYAKRMKAVATANKHAVYDAHRNLHFPALGQQVDLSDIVALNRKMMSAASERRTSRRRPPVGGT